MTHTVNGSFGSRVSSEMEDIDTTAEREWWPKRKHLGGEGIAKAWRYLDEIDRLNAEVERWHDIAEIRAAAIAKFIQEANA